MISEDFEDEDTPLVQQAKTAPASDWSHKSKINNGSTDKTDTKTKELPSSSDSDFWGEDAEIVQLSQKEIERRHKQTAESMQNHRVSIVGREFICNSCPYSHSIPLSVDDFTVEGGRIVPIKLELI